MRRRDKLLEDIRFTKGDLHRARERCAEAERIMQSEHADVARLQGITLTSLISIFRGDRSERLAIEDQEYVAAKLAFDQASGDMRLLEGEVVRLERELDELENPVASGQRHRMAMEAFQAAMVEGNIEAGEELKTLAEQIAELKANDREIKEAIDAGQSVCADTRSSLQWLDVTTKAAMDRSGDTIGFRQSLSSMMIESKGRRNSDYELECLDGSLSRFKRELNDVDQRMGSEAGRAYGKTDLSASQLYADSMFRQIMKEHNAPIVAAAERRVLDTSDWVIREIARLEGLREDNQRSLNDSTARMHSLIENA